MTDYRTPIHFAVRENNAAVLKRLLEVDPLVPYASGQNWHDRPEQMAVDRGLESVETLLREHQFSNWQISVAGDEVAQAFERVNLKQ